MPTTIAISGKGGSGKTNLTAMIIRVLHNQAKRAVDTVNVDSNSCLGQTCGVKLVETIAEVREKSRRWRPISSASDCVRTFEYDIQRAILSLGFQFARRYCGVISHDDGLNEGCFLNFRKIAGTP
jgi:CO dehydrogenase maturation factor